MLHVLSRTASPLIRFVQWILQWAVDFHSRHFVIRGRAVSRINANAPGGRTCPAVPAGVFAPTLPSTVLLKLIWTWNPASERKTCSSKKIIREIGKLLCLKKGVPRFRL